MDLGWDAVSQRSHEFGESTDTRQNQKEYSFSENQTELIQT
jgi:hypothetical protein